MVKRSEDYVKEMNRNIADLETLQLAKVMMEINVMYHQFMGSPDVLKLKKDAWVKYRDGLPFYIEDIRKVAYNGETT